MNLYHDIVLFLHLLGLVMGMGIGFANMAIARMAAAAPPETATVLRTLPEKLSRISTVGLVVLVVTGLLLLFTVGGTASYAFSQFWFWVKLLGSAAMIAIAYLVYQAQVAIRDGREPQFKQYLPMVGPAMGALGLAVTLFAVFVFH